MIPAIYAPLLLYPEVQERAWRVHTAPSVQDRARDTE